MTVGAWTTPSPWCSARSSAGWTVQVSRWRSRCRPTWRRRRSPASARRTSSSATSRRRTAARSSARSPSRSRTRGRTSRGSAPGRDATATTGSSTAASSWITNGAQADWVCLLARTCDEGGYQGMSMLVVPTATPGFTVARTLDKLGNRSSRHRRARARRLYGCRWRTPSGRSGAGSSSRWRSSRTSGSSAATWAWPVPSAPYAGPSTSCVYREAFGKPLLANQALQYRLAELLADIDVPGVLLRGGRRARRR